MLDRFARPAIRFVAPALLALSLMSAALPAAQPAAAAGVANLKVVSCTITPNTEYPGEWFYLTATYTNAGTADTGPYRLAMQHVFWAKAFASQNLFLGAYGDEVRVEKERPSLKPGQVASFTGSVTKHIVDTKQWGFFLDIKHQVAEGGSYTQETRDNFCSAWVAPLP
jgi:hypothetical protein